MRGFQPGFRFSSFDGLLLVVGAAGSLLTWPRTWWIGFTIAFVVGHFFLFCNVFRISRALELVWAAVFIVLIRLTVANGIISLTTTILISLAATGVVIGIEMKKPSYHGAGWRRVNPSLREWWEKSVGMEQRDQSDSS